MMRMWHWLSFADPGRPKGQQALGVILVETTDEDPVPAMGQPIEKIAAMTEEQWGFLAAVGKTKTLGINPGGEVRGLRFDQLNSAMIKILQANQNMLLTREQAATVDEVLVRAMGSDAVLKTHDEMDPAQCLCVVCQRKGVP